LGDRLKPESVEEQILLAVMVADIFFLFPCLDADTHEKKIGGPLFFFSNSGILPATPIFFGDPLAWWGQTWRGLFLTGFPPPPPSSP